MDPQENQVILRRWIWYRVAIPGRLTSVPISPLHLIEEILWIVHT